MVLIGRAYLGLVVVALGLVWLLDETEVWDGGDVLGAWWPVAIVGLGVSQLLADRSAVVGSAVLAGSGLILLGITTGTLSAAPLSVVWPVALIGAGVWFLSGRPRFRRRDAGPRIAAVAALRTTRVVSRSPVFVGGTVTVVLGGSTIDLEDAVPVSGGAHLHCTVVMGGLDILVPPQWKVRIRGLPILGTWDDTRRRPPQDSSAAPELVVDAVVVLGGIEVKQRSRWG